MVRDAAARAEIPPGTLHMLILRTLEREGPLHGYAIARHIEHVSEGVLGVEEGSLYPALQRMLIKGWVTSEWTRTPGNRQVRAYRLSTAGRRRLRTEVGEFARVMRAISRVLEPA